MVRGGDSYAGRLTRRPAPVVEAHRAEQARKRLRREPGLADTDLVLAAPHGDPWWPSNFDRVWRHFKKKHGVACRFHDLHHTHATQQLKAGAHPKVVSERLGHASIGITLDIHSHVVLHQFVDLTRHWILLTRTTSA